MRKRLSAFALFLAALLALGGCSMIEIDQEMDRAEPVAIVNGETITKGEVLPEFESYYAIYKDYVTARDLAADIIDSYVADRVLAQKAEALGMDALTDEELAEITAEAEAAYEAQLELESAEFEGDGRDEAAIRQAAADHLAELGYTLEGLTEYGREAKARERLRESIVQNETVTDDEVRARYDQNVLTDEAQYSASPTAFEYSAMQGGTIYWIPEGYRQVKHILIQFADAQMAELEALESELTAVENQIAAFDDADAEGAVDAADEPEEGAEDAPEAERDALIAQKAQIEGDIDRLRQEAVSALQPQIDEIYQKLEAGASFDALIEEYGADPGMTAEPMRSTGYYISAQSTLYQSAFTAAAAALENVGDISAPTATDSGVHIIRYEADAASGPVAFSALSDALFESLLSEKQDAAYNAQVEAWIAESDIKTYPERLG